MTGLMDGKTPNHCGLSRQNIMESVYASLERLGIDTIDLLYFHRPDHRVSAEESLLAVDDLIRQDLVRYFAVSNFSVSELEHYQSTEHHIGPTLRAKVCAVQNSFNLLDGETQEHQGVLRYCADHRLAMIAWSPLAEGLLTSRYLQPDKIGLGDRLYDQNNQRYRDKDITEKLTELNRIAQNNEISLVQLVLAYMLTLPGMGPVIPAVSSLAQLEENAAAAAVDLSADDRAQIAAIID